MSDDDPTKPLKQDRIAKIHRCEPGRTALLVVDMQHGFLDLGASLAVPGGREIIPNVRKLVAAFRDLGAAVIFTRFVYSSAVPCLRGDPFGIEHLPASPGEPAGFGRPSSNCLVGPEGGQGVESAEIIDDLAPRPAELVVSGHSYDKFLGTPLDLALRSRGITHLVVTGVAVEICVNCTVLSASAREYRVTVATDAVGALEDWTRRACFEIWRRKFACLADTDEIVAELRAGRGPRSSVMK